MQRMCSQKLFSQEIFISKMNKSHQQLNSLIADPTLTCSIKTFTGQETTLELIDFKSASQSIDLPFSHIAFLRDQTNNIIECCQLGSAKLEQCRSSHLPSMKITTIKGKAQLETTAVQAEKGQLRKQLKKMTEGKGTVELIKVEWPHGTDIQVSFSSAFNAWVVYNGKETALCPLNAKNLQINQKEIIDFWLTQTQECKNVELLKQILARFTFCGKVSGDWKKVKWYSVIQTSSRDMICEDLFDARTLVQKVGFTFAKIKSLSMLNNEDQMIRALQKLTSHVQTSCCEGRDGRFGRCKVYLVSNIKKLVLGGFDIETLQDLLLNSMKELSESEVNEQQKINVFQELLLEIKNKGVKLPFPFKHYLQLFGKVLTLLKVCAISESTSKDNWMWVLKLTIYLQLKQISLQDFALSFFSNSQLKNYLSNVSLQELGPLKCPTTTIYSLVSPDPSFRRQLISNLQALYEDLQLHFKEIECENTNEINLKTIISEITQQPLNTLNHFFINAVPRLFQLKCLIRQLQMQSKEECYYKLAILVENQETFVNVEGNVYPFSMEAIVNAYQEALNKQNHAKKMVQKADSMKAVTESIENLKNEEFKAEEKLITIELSGKNTERKEVKKAVENILKLSTMNYNPYYVLMIQLKDREVHYNCNLESVAESIVSNTYPNLKAIPL